MTAATTPPLETWSAINAVFMVICTLLLPVVVLGLALFYLGLTQRRSSFLMLTVPMILAPFVFIDWFVWGYSLCYSSSANHFIGNLDFAVLRHLRNEDALIYSTPRGDILSLNHFLFNGFFKVLCVALTFPACIAERGRLLPMLVFLFIWSCFIYNPVTYWVWNRNGWLSTELGTLPVIDFAGGNCIHVVSGFTGLAYSYLLGPRNPKILYNYRSSNSGFVAIGTFFIVCGWCGFIAGCDYKFSTLSLYIFVNILLCSFTSGLVWLAIDFYFSQIPLEGTTDDLSVVGSSKHVHDRPQNRRFHIRSRKLSMVSFSSGLMTGLVLMTPAGGYIASPTEFWKSFIFGLVGAVGCNMATRIKYYFAVDDAFDLFAIHGISGIMGSLMVGIFANKAYGSNGGWITHHWKQFGYQILGSVVSAAYVFVLSLFFLYVIDLIPGLHLRIDKNFNKRRREQVTNNEDPESLAERKNDSKEDEEMEQAELLGCDAFEFNGEYTMDFMEFIKEIRPEDYQDEHDEKRYLVEDISGYGTDFQLHPENLNQIYKKHIS